MKDSYRHKGLRKKLIAKLEGRGIVNQSVLAAFDAVPRHFFLDSSFANQAYEDIAFQIGAGQTISQPYTVAYQTSLLACSKGQNILEIGTGSGFQTSILCELGCKVVSIERQKSLYLKAKSIIHELGYTPKLFFGDGYKGKPVYGPYDGILVTCGAPLIPEALKMQLKIGGKLVIPVGEGQKQKMICLTRKENEIWETIDFGDFSFVPMLEKTAK